MMKSGLPEDIGALEDESQSGQGEIIADRIKSGTLLIAEGALLPTELQCGREPYVAGWGTVQNLDSKSLDQMIERAGWKLFFIAGAVDMIAFGADQKKAAGKALRRIVNSLKAPKFNCLEITEVAAKRFLGFPYVKVSVHLRHIQPGLVLFAD